MQQAAADRSMSFACGIAARCLRRRYFCQYESKDWVQTLVIVTSGDDP